jgi:hypothetical protein
LREEGNCSIELDKFGHKNGFLFESFLSLINRPLELILSFSNITVYEAFGLFHLHEIKLDKLVDWHMKIMGFEKNKVAYKKE